LSGGTVWCLFFLSSDYDRAIADYNEAIRLTLPDGQVAVAATSNLRSMAEQKKGRDESNGRVWHSHLFFSMKKRMNP
jgi:hypothetical protein